MPNHEKQAHVRYKASRRVQEQAQVVFDRIAIELLHDHYDDKGYHVDKKRKSMDNHSLRSQLLP
jgi:hypothetical protein